MTQTTAQATVPQPLGLSRRPSPSEAMFDAFRAQNRPAFIGYMPYGFPDPETTHDALRTMVTHGVDAVEIGLPYTDPLMDGPTIQDAVHRALTGGARLADVFRTVEAVAATGAYCRAMASNYNHVPRPPVVSVADGVVTTLVRRETIDDLLALDVG